MPDEGDYGIGSNNWPGLAKLVEEMGELTQVLMKLVAKSGSAGAHWDGKGQLRDRIIEEAGDVRAALIFFCEANDLSKEEVHDRADTKLSKFRFWHTSQAAPVLCQYRYGKSQACGISRDEHPAVEGSFGHRFVS